MTRTTKIFLLSIPICLCLIFIFHKTLLHGMSWIITSHNTPKTKVDYIVLLMGQQDSDRADHARELLSNNLADKILLPKDIDTKLNRYQLLLSSFELHKKLLLMDGVSHDKLVFLDQCNTTSTTDEAYCVKNFIESQNSQKKLSLVLVTNWYHSGRAEWLFKKVLKDDAIIFSSPAKLKESTEENWWTKEYSFLAVFSEYIKWVYWRIKFISL